LKRAVRVNTQDNVAVVVENVVAGDDVAVENLRVRAAQNIPRGHKVALAEIAGGEYVVKYALPIARASADIHPGEHVHLHNVSDITMELCDMYSAEFRSKGARRA
jgi:hypothetical protein